MLFKKKYLFSIIILVNWSLCVFCDILNTDDTDHNGTLSTSDFLNNKNHSEKNKNISDVKNINPLNLSNDSLVIDQSLDNNKSVIEIESNKKDLNETSNHPLYILNKFENVTDGLDMKNENVDSKIFNLTDALMNDDSERSFSNEWNQLLKRNFDNDVKLVSDEIDDELKTLLYFASKENEESDKSDFDIQKLFNDIDGYEPLEEDGAEESYVNQELENLFTEKSHLLLTTAAPNILNYKSESTTINNPSILDTTSTKLVLSTEIPTEVEISSDEKIYSEVTITPAPIYSDTLIKTEEPKTFEIVDSPASVESTSPTDTLKIDLLKDSEHKFPEKDISNPFPVEEVTVNILSSPFGIRDSDTVALTDLLSDDTTAHRLVSNVQKPGRRQSSLAFVFDSTGSMWDDLQQLKEGAEKIMAAMNDREDKPIYNYVLVPFHDPQVGPVTVTDDDELFRKKLSEIDVYGGGDCPEMSLGGIRKAIEVSLPRSYIYVFTDATSADHYLVGGILDEVQRMESQVVFVLTGDCGNRTVPQYTVYEKIAQASSGQIFHLDKSDVNQILDFVRNTLDTRRVSLLAVSKPKAISNEKHDVDVDESLKQFMVSVAGENPRINVVNPSGEIVSLPPQVNSVLDLEKIKVVNVVEPEAGRWAVNVGSDSDHTVRLTGLSDLKFDHGFSIKPTHDLDETNHRPMQGAKNYLLIKPLNDSVFYNVTSVDLTSLDGQFIKKIPLRQSPVDDTIYVTDEFLPPNEFFNIAINGFDIHGNPFQRATSTAIKPQLPDKPFITTDDKVSHSIHRPLKLRCHVESLVPVVVQWFKDERPISDDIYREQSGNVYWEHPDPTLDLVGRYTCKARNTAGENEKFVYLELNEPPQLKKDQKSVVTVAPGASVEANCIAIAGKPTPITYWIKNNINLTAEEGIEIYENSTLLIQNVSTSHKGIYQCAATNNAGVDYYKFDLRVQAPPIFLDKNNAHYTAKAGETLVLQCEAQGEPKPLISWLKDGLPAGFSAEKYRNDDNSLVFSHLRENDAGVYVCAAYNTAGTANKTMTVIVTVPPKIHPVGDDTVKVVEGQIVSLACPVYGNPMPVIQWLVNSTEVSMDNKILDDDNTLKFVANSPDTGNYKCVASNDIGKASREWVLVIYVQPSIYPPEDEVIKVRPYEQVIFSCRPLGYPTPEVKWKKDGQFLSNSSDISVHKNGDLVVYESYEKKAGNYICMAVNEVGITQKTFNLIINIPPQIMDNVTTDIKLIDGDDYSIPCTVTGNPIPYVTWTKDGKLVSKDEMYIDFKNTLVLTAVSEKSNGIYKCEAVNSEGSYSKNYTISVMVPPFMEKTGPFEINVREGDSIMLECLHSKAFPPPSIVWTKDGNIYEEINNELSTSIEVITKKVHNSKFLKIDEVASSDSGKYECTVSNVAGDAKEEFLVTVLRSPTIREARDVPKQVVRRIGEVVRMNCEAEGYPPPKISWRRGGEIVGNGHILEINNIQPFHKDNYICRAVNSVGKKEQKFYLDVLEPPVLTTPGNESIEIIRSGNVRLSCNAKSHPKPNYNWILPSTVREDLVSIDGHDLYFFDANLDQEGLYICKVSNPVGVEVKTFNVTIVEPPVIERVPQNGTITLQETENFRLECYVQGNPKVTLKWYHNGNPITEEEFQQSFTARASKASQNVWVYALIARNISIEHGGKYSCVGVNKVGHAERDFDVSVLMPPKLNNGYNTRKSNYLEGLPITLQCMAIGNPVPEIKWEKDGEVLYRNNSLVYIEPNGEALYIENAQIEHVGTYKCTATNRVGEVSKDFDVNILVAPRITETTPLTEKFVPLVIGDTLRLNCDAIGNPLPDILWIKHSKVISNVEYEHQNKTMVLQNVTLKDSGQYSCIAINLAGAMEFNFDVFVQEPPHVLRVAAEPPDLNVKIHRPFVLHCDVGGTPEPNITWYKDDVRLSADHSNRTDFHISSDGSRLQIITTLLSDAGKYVCSAENSAGIIQQPYQVDVTIPVEWSPWSDWSVCSVSCGPGLRFRRRTCIIGVPLDENEIQEHLDSTLCNGLSTDTETCQMLPCPIHGGWSLWTNWTHCSESCGKEAVRKRYRYCNSPQPSFGGEKCNGNDYEQENCDVPDCAIDGNWSGWSDWTSCSTTCGAGVRSRYRKCNNPKPAHGGAQCKGSNAESKDCNLQPCPVDGGWSNWSSWTPCSQSCGSSSKIKRRTCTNPAPQFGGKYCEGENLMIEKCDVDPCKSPPKHANLRVKGVLNGEKIMDNFISANISRDGEMNTVSATSDNLLKNQAGWFPYLTFLVTPVSWNLAEQEEDESVGMFRQKSQVAFSTGQELVIKHVGRGKDKDGNIQVEIEVNGEVPIVQEEARIYIEPFSEEYIQTGPSTLYASANNNLNVDGRALTYRWNNNVTYSQGPMPYLSEKLSTKSINMEYNPHSRKMRYVVSTAIQRDKNVHCPIGFQKDPHHHHCIDVDECELKNGAGCHSTQLCENTFGSFRCYCQSGYKSIGNGRRCLDVNECLQNIHQCSHQCENIPGGYECTCPKGMILASDLRTCVKIGYRSQNTKSYGELLDPLLTKYKSLNGLSGDSFEESVLFEPDIGDDLCDKGYKYVHGLCEDIDECLAGTDVTCSEGQSCLNTKGSYFCIPIPCPENYKRDLDRSSCIQFCGAKNAPICSEGALVAQTVSYTMLTLDSNKIKERQPILMLQMYSVDGKPLPMNRYTLQDATPGDSFEVNVENSRGILLTKEIPVRDRVHRVTVVGNSYDADGKTLLYTTKYIIYIYIFE